MPDFRRIDDPSLQAQLAEDYSFWDGMPGHASYRLACGACGKTFYARMPTARWCSDRCAREGAICDRYGIDYDTRALSLPSRDEAERWTIEHQFGRRNLTKYRRAELALKLKLLIFPARAIGWNFVQHWTKSTRSASLPISQAFPTAPSPSSGSSSTSSAAGT